MWTDIDYMYKRWIFTNDQQYFPTDRMREIVSYLHSHEQQYSAYTLRTAMLFKHIRAISDLLMSSPDDGSCSSLPTR